MASGTILLYAVLGNRAILEAACFAVSLNRVVGAPNE